MNLFKSLHQSVMGAIQRLGIIGTISYVGAMTLFLVVLGVNFEAEPIKAVILSSIGTVLLIFAGAVYWLESKEETAKVKEALGVLREVFNRMAEQISTADKDKTVSITMTINNLPDKIAEVIKKTSNKQNG